MDLEKSLAHLSKALDMVAENDNINDEERLDRLEESRSSIL